jgi:hypothetical protein
MKNLFCHFFKRKDHPMPETTQPDPTLPTSAPAQVPSEQDIITALQGVDAKLSAAADADSALATAQTALNSAQASASAAAATQLAAHQDVTNSATALVSLVKQRFGLS